MSSEDQNNESKKPNGQQSENIRSQDEQPQIIPPSGSQPPKEKKINWSALKELIKKIPFVGELAVTIFEWLGWSGVVGAVIGAGLVCLSLYCYWLPEKVVNPFIKCYTKVPYKTISTNLKFETITNKIFMSKYEFLSPTKDSLEADARGQKSLSCTCVSDKFSNNFNDFNLTIKATLNYNLFLKVFLVTKDNFFRRLKEIKNNPATTKEPASWEFKVPKSRKDNRIILLFSVIGTGKEPIGDCTNFFKAKIYKR